MRFGDGAFFLFKNLRPKPESAHCEKGMVYFMEITWFGTASLLIENEGSRILIDPFLPLRGSENHPSLLDYQKEDSILITHGHIDHLGSIPQILLHSDATVYCSALPAATLEKKNADSDRIVVIRPGNTLDFGKIKVSVMPGKHIKFDSKLVRHTLCNPHIIRYFPNFLSILFHHHTYMEGNETLTYLIEANGKKILVLGSLALHETTNYPKYVDMLILPYQGATDLVSAALSVIARIEPRTVLLDHFDDAFPPISSRIDTKPLRKTLKERYPDLPVVKPTAGKAVTLL